MENKIQMFVCAVIMAWSGHQNQRRLKYGNKATMEMLGQTPLRLTILRSYTGKLLGNANARQVFSVSYAWALESSTVMW